MHLFAKGTQTKLYIGKQVDEFSMATTVYPIPFNSTSLGSSTNMTDAETITGKRDARRPIMGNHDVTGSITVPLDTITFGLYLAMGFKEDDITPVYEDSTQATISSAATIPANATVSTALSVTTSEGSDTITVHPNDKITVDSTAYVVGKNNSAITLDSSSVVSISSFIANDHVFYVSDEMDSFTIVQSIPMGTTTIPKTVSGSTVNETVQAYHHDVFIGCKLNSMSFEISGDGELTADLDIMGMDHKVPAMSNDSIPSGISVQNGLPFDRIVALGSNAPTDDGEQVSEITVAKSFSTNIDFGLDGDAYFLGQDGYRGTISEGILKATGTLNCMLKDDSLLRKASNGTESKLSIQANGYDANNYMKIEFANVMYEEATPGIEGPRGIAVDFNYHAYSTDDISVATTANTSSVKITLRNQESTKYYAT